MDRLLREHYDKFIKSKSFLAYEQEHSKRKEREKEEFEKRKKDAPTLEQIIGGDMNQSFVKFIETEDGHDYESMYWFLSDVRAYKQHFQAHKKHRRSSITKIKSYALRMGRKMSVAMT